AVPWTVLACSMAIGKPPAPATASARRTELTNTRIRCSYFVMGVVVSEDGVTGAGPGGSQQPEASQKKLVGPHVIPGLTGAWQTKRGPSMALSVQTTGGRRPILVAKSAASLGISGVMADALIVRAAALRRGVSVTSAPISTPCMTT